MSAKKRTRNTRLVRHDRSLGAFAAVAQAVSQTLDLEQLLYIALAKVFEVMDLGRGVIYLLDTGARELVLKAHRGVPEQLVGALGRIEVAEADIQLWLEHREQAFKLETVFDQATLARVRVAIGKREGQSYVVTPLWSKEMLRGAMILESRSKCWFSPEELELLGAVGSQIAVAIENAELFEQTRAKAEELKASEAKYRDLIEDMNDGYVVYLGDDRETIAFANKKFAQIVGYSLEELIRQSAVQLFPATEREAQLELRRRLLDGDTTLQRFETKVLTKTGEEVPVEVSFKIIGYEGEFALSVIMRDITERKRAEEALQESEEKYRHLFQDLTDAAFLADAETGLILETNLQGEALLGKSRHEIVGMYQAQLHPQDKADEYRRRFAKHIEKGHSADYDGEIIKKDGTIVPVRISASPLTIRGQRLILGLFRDITERKRAEEEIQRHTERIEVTAELTRIITSSLNIEDVYEPFIAGVRRLVDCDIASIALVEGDRLRLVAVSSAVETEAEAGLTIPLMGSATEWVVENKRTNIQTDFAQEKQFTTDEAHLRIGLRSAIWLPLFSRGEVIGTFNLSSRRSHAYGEREQEILEELAGQIAVAIENHRLYEEAKRSKEDLEIAYEQAVNSSRALEQSKEELEDAYLKMARTLVLTLEARDPYTRGHSERVAQLSRQIAYEMHLPPEQMKKIETAARLHDLGKIGIPDGILLKPGPITPSERAEIQLHPTRGVDMLRHLGFLNGTLPIIEGHHERYDGGGYPSSLRGEQTPLGGRILAVADAYDAMTSARPYRPAMTSEQAIKVLREGGGSQWDPEVVEAFLRAFGQSLHEGENAD